MMDKKEFSRMNRFLIIKPDIEGNGMLKLANGMEEELKFGKMDQDTKAIGRMTWLTE